MYFVDSSGFKMKIILGISIFNFATDVTFY